MKLIGYFARFFATVLGITLSVLVMLVVAVTLVEAAGKFTHEGASAWTALTLGGLAGIQFAYQLLPMTCLLSALVSGAMLARRGEIIAAQAAGIGWVRLSGAFGLVVVLAGLLGALAGEFVVPRSVAMRELTERRQLRRVDALTRFYNRRNHWFKDGDTVLYLPVVDGEKQRFLSPVMYRLEDSLLHEVIEADELRYDGSHWWLTQVQRYTVDQSGVEQLDALRIKLAAKPRDLIDVTGDPRQMRVPQIQALIERRQRAGFDTAAHRIEVHERLSYPALALVMFLLVSPWVLEPRRDRSIPASLGVGVALMGAIAGLHHLVRLLALGRQIPPSLGPWTMVGLLLLCVPVSYLLYQQQRR